MREKTLAQFYAQVFVYTRKSQGLTQIALSKKLGITQVALSHIEQGKNIARPELLLRLAALHGTSWEELVYQTFIKL